MDLLPTSENPARVLVGDALETLRQLPAGCVHCVATSPPFYGLRDYGTGRWDGGDKECDHRETTATRQHKSRLSSTLGGSKETCHGSHVAKSECGKCGAIRVDSQVGLEPSLNGYVSRLVEIFREVRRVLHPSGVVWLNLGDSYCASGTGRFNGGSAIFAGRDLNGHASATTVDKSRQPGMKPKDLMGVPWAVAFALRADGWYLRSGCPWVKRNSMPESTTDRPASALEYVFLLSKSERYYYDHTAVRVESDRPDLAGRTSRNFGPQAKGDAPGQPRQTGRDVPYPSDRNRRNTDWYFESFQGLYADPDPLAFMVNPVPSDFAHFAMWPPLLVEPMVKAGSSEKGCCPECFAPWVRQTERKRKPTRPGRNFKPEVYQRNKAMASELSYGNRDPQRHCTEVTTLGWQPSCDCDAGEPIPALVLDPFAGSGTTLAVAVKLKRRALGIELNPEYAKLAERRLAEPLCVGGLFPPTAPVVRTLYPDPPAARQEDAR